MNNQVNSRKVITKARLHQENLDHNMLSRTKAEINQKSDHIIESEARELMGESRKQQEYVKETMLSRVEAEIDHS